MPGVVEEPQFKRVTVKELHPTFAAEVQGVDFLNLDDEALKEVLAAVHKYGVCVFRHTGMDDTAHVRFSEKLGELDNIKRFIVGNRKLRYPYYELFDAGNINDDDSILDPEAPRAHANRGNRLFHTDSSYNPRRASYSLLRAVEIPPPGNGGNTEFADSRTAFTELDDEIKERLVKDDLVGRHTFAQSRKMGSPEFFADLDPSSFNKAAHKIAQVHEPSGRVNLFIGAHLHHIEGLEEEESAKLVEMLNKHATQPKLVVSIDWEGPGDLIIWDNRAVLHRAAGGTFEGKYRRDLRRTTVHDDSPTAWGLNQKGEAQPYFNTSSAKLTPSVATVSVTTASAATASGAA